MARLLTIREASALLNVHHSTLRRWDKAGLLQPLRIGPARHRRYTQAQIDRLLQGETERDAVEAG
jgi:excisionase family DNA binding protein